MRFEPEDFIVNELPLYEPSRSGTHTYFAIRKRNLTTLDAINQIGRLLQVNPRNIGYAGLKDKRSISTQVLSIEGISPEQILKIQLPNIDILWAEPHAHKLRVGHLRGNQFQIMMRNVKQEQVTLVEEKITQLATNGVPNRFGEQRFGNKQNSHLIGKALLIQEWEKALEYILDGDTTHLGKLSSRIESARKQTAFEKAVALIPHRLRKLYLSAYQSFLFNCILKKRLPDLKTLLDGDIAIKHINGAPFLVENADIEQPRADAFEISPSGPIFGYKMRQPIGKTEEIETELLAEECIKPELFRKVAGIRLPGSRRSLRVPMELHKVKVVEHSLGLSFTLPAGSYATVVLEEIKDYISD